MRTYLPSLLLAAYLLLLPLLSLAQTGTVEKELPKLENPISPEYLKKHLAKKSPRLILTPALERNLKQKLTTDPLVQAYYQYLQAEAKAIQEKPLLKRELEGFRLLAVSREMVRRMGILCMVYRIDKDREILKRIDAELQAVCAFEDWNLQHFLDVAEMAFAVSLAVDWTGDALPKATVALAKASLIEKALVPSYNEGGQRMGWINGSNNWNAVCHGGMVAASLAIADLNPELAAKTLARALEKLPNSLHEYGPDGVYPEGPTYWEYGTSYAVMASNLLSSALGSDFGISASPGFMESARFRLQATAPSGEFFNFADSGDRHGGSGSVLLAWFAAKTGDGLYFDRAFFKNPTNAGRFAGPGMVWLSQFSQQKMSELPLEWCGKGTNPVAVFRGGKNDPRQFYLAAKGGRAALSHGNMDAGTFVFDLDGVRWVLDPGNQNYYLLNRIGFQLANHKQDSERWTLLTKNNQGHSTLTVNHARFLATGYAPITDFQTGTQPEVSIDMSELFEGHLVSAQRRFVKESGSAVLVEDQFEINDSTRHITWAIMTTAEVIPTDRGAVLRQDGKQLTLSILTPENLQVSVISLDPPPLAIDKTIENLKRIEIRLPAYLIKDNKGMIRIRLAGE